MVLVWVELTALLRVFDPSSAFWLHVELALLLHGFAIA
ncbi:hypothetical protein BSLA_02f3951 [Burkholderia stabilis]|nr:hypothetical protein BSLA_02f3951 [Burkholderia stabilis]